MRYRDRLMKSVGVWVLIALASTTAGCGGREKGSPPTSTGADVRQGAHAVRAEIKKHWSAAGATQVRASHSEARTVREELADRVILSDAIPDGASAAAVRQLLGTPDKRSKSAWSYLVARYKPSQGWGATCERYLVVHFLDAAVADLEIPPPICPPGVNP